MASLSRAAFCTIEKKDLNFELSCVLNPTIFNAPFKYSDKLPLFADQNDISIFNVKQNGIWLPTPLPESDFGVSRYNAIN